jgi:TonB family protein
MPENRHPGRLTLGLLPEPEGRSASFFTSSIVNLTILALLLFIGMTAKRAIDQHQYEQTVLIVPNTPEPPPPAKIKLPEPPKVELPEPPKPDLLKLDTPRINVPKVEIKPDLKPLQMEAKVQVPAFKTAKPNVIVAPQPKSALASAPMPAQVPQIKVSTAPVHLGQTFGVTPNPNATRPATIAAIGNPYGGMNGRAIAPHGVVGGVGIGNGIKPGGPAGVVGKVASAGIPGATNFAPGSMGKVASAGIPAMTTVAAAPKMVASPVFTNLEVLSKPPVQYTPEAKQFKVQGDVILRVTFMSTGQVVVQNVVHGLGHGLDEEARRVAQQIRFRPATRNGQAIDTTTNIIITFQLA